ncbi:hypothetical protein WG907_00395 [Sphingobium sp. AN558]|uniref:alpha/beta hydrolase family protein n=1 Tax=Sphingobium sp. AN558 TaxID=3133442 RepID=UPI0030C2CB84
MKKHDLHASEEQTISVDGVPVVSRRMMAGSFAVMAAWLTGSGIGRAATRGSAAGQYMPAIGTDYATTDPVYFDPEFPPIHFPHSFKSKAGKPIQSFMWLANGPEAKGCVIISPQANGGDSMDSLIPAILSAGINVMRFNPRGMWDEYEDYSIAGSLDDLLDAIAFLRENGGRHAVPGSGDHPRQYQIDLDHIAVLGKSGGGGLNGLIAASESPYLNTMIAVEPARLRVLPPYYDKHFEEVRVATAGRIDQKKWFDKLTPADRERMDVLKAAPKLVDKNVLLIGSMDQDYVQNIHKPIVQAMNAAGAKHFSAMILEAGNSFMLNKRIALSRIVISWLKNECGF